MINDTENRMMVLRPNRNTVQRTVAQCLRVVVARVQSVRPSSSQDFNVFDGRSRKSCPGGLGGTSREQGCIMLKWTLFLFLDSKDDLHQVCNGRHICCMFVGRNQEHIWFVFNCNEYWKISGIELVVRAWLTSSLQCRRILGVAFKVLTVHG